MLYFSSEVKMEDPKEKGAPLSICFLRRYAPYVMHLIDTSTRLTILATQYIQTV